MSENKPLKIIIDNGDNPVKHVEMRQLSFDEAFNYPSTEKFFSTLITELSNGTNIAAKLSELTPAQKADHFDNAKVLIAVSYFCCGMSVNTDFYKETDMVNISYLYGMDPEVDSKYFEDWCIGGIKPQENEIIQAVMAGYSKLQK